MMIENLRALIFRPHGLTAYQKGLAIQEFQRMEADLKESREQKDELISTWKSTKSPACMDELINHIEQSSEVGKHQAYSKPFSKRLEETKKHTIEYNMRSLTNAFKSLIDGINETLLKMFNSR